MARSDFNNIFVKLFKIGVKNSMGINGSTFFKGDRYYFILVEWRCGKVQRQECGKGCKPIAYKLLKRMEIIHESAIKIWDTAEWEHFQLLEL